MEKKRVLVVYYSDSGHTRKAAEYIANATDGVVEAVTTPILKKGIWGYIKRIWLSLHQKTIAINESEHDPSHFDLVVVGAPVWASHVANPIRSYLTEYCDNFPEVAFFVTMGMHGGEGALRDMRDVSGCAPLTELQISETDRKTDLDVSKMNSFISQFGRLYSPLPKIVAT